MSTVWDRVRSHAEAQPSTLAIRGEVRLSYRRLVDRVTEVARELAMVARPGQVVAIDARSPDAGLVAVLAAQAAGVVFLPLDVTAPAQRREYVLADAGAVASLTQTGPALVGVAPTGHRPVRSLDGAAYLIYTSGTTGRPKGVIVSTRALLDRLDGLAERPGFTAGSSMLALTALSFDISLAELLLPMWTGGQVVTVEERSRVDARAFAEAISRWKPSHVQATPSFWRLMVASGWNQTTNASLWCGGEALTGALAGDLLRRGREVWNMYGPTEATIWATAAEVRPSEPVRLGEPLRGTAVHLRASSGELIDEPGVDGEIVLAGSGIADGYLDDSAGANARFGELRGVRCYTTGDRARRGTDGSLEFLGRLDNQIKLRGHRIELGEIEAVLEAHPDVVEAVALGCFLDDPARAHIAVVVATGAKRMADRDLRTWLSRQLPNHMMPRSISTKPELPHTSAGKVDRSRLAAMTSGGGHA